MLSDLRFALRYFARHRATTALIVAVLALGTGANTVIFSFFQAQFLRPAPGVPNDASLTRLWAQERATRSGSWQLRGFTLPELNALSAHRDVFRDVAAWTEDEVIIGGDSAAARAVTAQFVTPNYFGTLGLSLAAGQANGAVLSSAAADELFGSATAAVGRRLMVNETNVVIAGVAPPLFQGAARDMRKPAIWLPIGARAALLRVTPSWSTDQPRLGSFARLAGASRKQATALVRQTITNTLPDSASRVGMTRMAQALGIASGPPWGEAAQSEAVAFTIMMGIGVLILLVACMNVSSLMVAAGLSRRHEIAVRLSIGASRGRLLRQLVTESTLLAMMGGVAGLMMAWGTLTYITKTDSGGMELAPDPVTFGFVLVMAVATGVLFGLSPALNATGGAVASSIRDAGSGSGGRSRLQRGFVVAQIALSQPLLVLLSTMLLLVLADYRPLPVEMSRRVISVAFNPIERAGVGQGSDAVRALIPRIAQLPEVVSAVPEAAGYEIRGVTAPDAQRDSGGLRVLNIQAAAPGWFAMVDVPILLGRDVSFADTSATSYPIVIGSNLAHSLWGDANPIGRTLPSAALRGLHQDSLAMTVVGVYDATRRLPGMSWSENAVRGSMAASVTPAFTARGGQWSKSGLLVRTRGGADRYLPTLNAFLREAAPTLPVASMETLAQADEITYRATVTSASMALGAGVLALVLASLGLFGVVSLSVRQRTREIGVRIAVGATPAGVSRMFLASGVRVSLVAMAIGLPLSIVALKVGMSTGAVIAPSVNPYLIGVVLAPVLVVVAVLATWVPARRAALVDPARTLRVE